MPMLGDVFLNTVYDESPGRSVNTTDHPIEGGVDITDHTERKPEIMDIEGIVVGPDAAMRLQKLKRYSDDSELLKYVYRNVKTDVIMVDFQTTHDADVADGFKFSITLKEMRIAKPSIVKVLDISTKTQTAPIANKGQQQTSGGTTTMYEVKPGETLGIIASKFGITTNKLYDRNRGVIGDDRNVIYAGMKLMIPTSGGVSAPKHFGDDEPNNARMVFK